jgi:hypothetical protein
MIELISSPLAQLVALWGMTTKATLQLMKSSKRDKALAVALMQPKQEEEQRPSMA